MSHLKNYRFADFFNRKSRNYDTLLEDIKALETFPPEKDKLLKGKEQDYCHATEYLNQFLDDDKKVKTLSKSEWDVICMLILYFIV